MEGKTDAKIDYTLLRCVESICHPLVLSEDVVDRLRLHLDGEGKLFLLQPEGEWQQPQVAQKDCVSLDHLISNLQPRNPLQFVSLAVSLASSLLQLHSTPWLPETWCNKSILFPIESNQPYVMIELGTPQFTAPAGVEDEYLSPYIVELGILLLELSQGRTFQEWVMERGDITLRPHDIKDRAAGALAWLEGDSRFPCVGPAYPEIIELCLKCSFTPVQAKDRRTLRDEVFRQVVYRDVVKKLESMYYTMTNPLKPKGRSVAQDVRVRRV